MQRLLSVIFLLTTFLLYSGVAGAYEKEIKSLSASMADNISKAGKKTIAVVDFTDLQGNVTELGRFLAEEFSVALAGFDKGFEIVDRTHLKSLLSEYKLSSTGIIDPQTARKLGQVAGVDALITGSITPFGDSVRVSAKILDTSTAKVISASSCDIAKTKAIEELLARGIETGQAASSPTSGSSYVPSAGRQQSKKIGDITITIKRLEVLNGRINLTLDIFNQLDKDLSLGWGQATLTDEKGNVFMANASSSTLNSKSNNDYVITFSNHSVDIKNIGLNFSFSLTFPLNNNSYTVSFMDVKALKPK
jgi:TolB-like protein